VTYQASKCLVGSGVLVRYPGPDRNRSSWIPATGGARGPQLQLTAEDEAFRTEVRAWLTENLSGEFAGLRGVGGPGREHEHFEQRLAWNRHLAASGWTCIGWPVVKCRPQVTPSFIVKKSWLES